MRKSPLPFAKLFKYVSPKDFIVLFDSETPQTIAFILSFSPSKKYVKKAARLFDDKERARHPDGDAAALEKRTSFVIRSYLKRCGEESFNQTFVREVEHAVDGMLANYEDSLSLRKLRKRLFCERP
jgi:hypothetical protein